MPCKLAKASVDLQAEFLTVVRSHERESLQEGSFWLTFADPEVLLQRIFAALVIALGVIEWRVQTGRMRLGRCVSL